MKKTNDRQSKAKKTERKRHSEVMWAIRGADQFAPVVNINEHHGTLSQNGMWTATFNSRKHAREYLRTSLFAHKKTLRVVRVRITEQRSR
jgi:hypothetical protein